MDKQDYTALASCELHASLTMNMHSIRRKMSTADEKCPEAQNGFLHLRVAQQPRPSDQ